ncbi:mucin-binding protein, partial [Ligilactobacillus sp. LYQ112]|uniref:mucin-binding protein n=1 Tax=Ligilactobacillus sp. LYQ112 TaxID=3391060 RepID=UPI0039838F0C
DWTPSTQTFPAVTSPTITGYTPSAAQSSAVDVTEGSADDTQTITYTANKEHAVVNYVDDATGKTVASETVDGTFGGTTTYDPTSEENTLKNDGYTIGSNDLPSGDKITFTQDGQVPTYTVHLNEGTTTYTPSNNPDGLELTHTVHQTIHYVYSDGSQAAPDATRDVTFQRNATKNNVTGAITYTDWTPSTQTFPAVTSPTITGYTPSAAQSSAVDVTESSADDTQTITYTANKEHAVVNYVDDATGKTVASETVDGTFGGTTTYDPTSEENTLKNDGYTIGSNDLPSGDKITFTQDGQVPTYTVHLNEGTTTYTPSNNPDGLELTHTVHQTIHYVYSDGSQAAPDATRDVTFQRNATKNNVTGAITYTDWTPSTQTFPAVTSPTITGYTPSAAQSSAVDVTEG